MVKIAAHAWRRAWKTSGLTGAWNPRRKATKRFRENLNMCKRWLGRQCMTHRRKNQAKNKIKLNEGKTCTKQNYPVSLACKTGVCDANWRNWDEWDGVPHPWSLYIVLMPGFLGSPIQDGGQDVSACSLIRLLCRLGGLACFSVRLVQLSNVCVRKNWRPQPTR